MEILKAASTVDFLAVVPTIAGGNVERSIVFVPFRGNRSFPTACRIDLPPRDRRADVRTVIHGALGILSRLVGADRVDVVIYTDRSFQAERGIPYLELGRAAVDGLTRAGFDVGLAACVAADGWGSYLDRTHHGSGHPLDEIRASDVGKRASTIMAEEGEPETHARDVPDADVSARDAVARILGFDVITEELDDEELVPFEREAPLVDILDMVLEGYDVPAIIALGLAAFESPATRDVALLHYAFGREVGERMAADATRWATIQRETGQSMDDLVEADLNAGEVNTESADMLLGRTDRVPDRARLGASIRMLRVLVAHAPDELRPAPLTMLAWCLWAVGSVAAAGAMLDRVAQLAPSYRMAALLRTWLDAGAVPDWLFAHLSS